MVETFDHWIVWRPFGLRDSSWAWQCQQNHESYFVDVPTGRCGFEVVSINGGSLRNAIPRESFAVLNVLSADKFRGTVDEIAATIRSELAATESNLSIEIEKADASGSVLDPSLQRSLLAAIYASPCGVIRMSDQVDGLVETSTNLSLVNIDSQKASIEFLSRSSVESAKGDLTNQIDATFAGLAATVAHSGDYPGWAPNADSETLRLMKQIYSEMYGEDAIVNAVHAGLECGIIGSHYPDLDMVSFGPTIKNPHSPDEMCHIASVEKYWRYMLEVLKLIQ